MSTTAEDDARLDVCLPKKLKEMIEAAAARSGQSLSEFAISTLSDRAKEVIHQEERTVLSERDRDLFLALLDDADAEPNEALRAAAEEYKRRMR